MKKDLVLQSVQNSVSSIFSKEDVINLINSIEESKGSVITTYDIGRAIDKMVDWVEHNEREFLDLESAELEMDYSNRIEVVGVPINLDSLREALENNFMGFGEAEDDIVELERETLVEGGEFRSTGDL
jgi:hypothetical protein